MFLEKTMSNLDRAIREALSKEDAEFLARFDAQSTPVGEVLDTFKGQWAVMNAFAAFISFALFGAFVYFVCRCSTRAAFGRSCFGASAPLSQCLASQC